MLVVRPSGGTTTCSFDEVIGAPAKDDGAFLLQLAHDADDLLAGLFDVLQALRPEELHFLLQVFLRPLREVGGDPLL